MSIDLNATIDRLAPVMNTFLPRKDATYEYHMMSDAFIWDDETPSSEIGDDIALRYLLRFRTSLLIGNPIEPLRPHWEYARTKWPNWAGFIPERCAYSDSFKREYDEYQSREDEFLSSFND
jgi:hypothetical protein